MLVDKDGKPLGQSNEETRKILRKQAEATQVGFINQGYDPNKLEIKEYGNVRKDQTKNAEEDQQGS